MTSILFGKYTLRLEDEWGKNVLYPTEIEATTHLEAVKEARQRLEAIEKEAA